MQIHRVIETCLYADDLDATAQFYAQVLGLAPVAAARGRHVFFRCGPGMVLLFDPAATEQASGDVPSHGARGPGHVAFAVDAADLPGWRQRLAAAGVAVEAEIAWPTGGRSLYFRDPAGNSLELTTPLTWGLEAV